MKVFVIEYEGKLYWDYYLKMGAVNFIMTPLGGPVDDSVKVKKHEFTIIKIYEDIQDMIKDYPQYFI